MTEQSTVKLGSIRRLGRETDRAHDAVSLTPNVTATVTPPETVHTGIAAAFAEGNTWFTQLPVGKQSEVVKYAVLHIANNSPLFELTKHGGNSQDYLNITIAIVRSGLVDAEELFVQAASSVKDADPEDELRKFFKTRTRGEPDTDGITVGTLLNAARQFGADFSVWEKTFDARGREAQYVPGNEGVCRKLLDRVVAADPLTYTLGDQAGPLVIARVPDNDTLPPQTTWEGDLPGTTLATAPDIMERAEGLVWLMRAGGKSENRIIRNGPPRAFVADFLPQMRGRYGARPLRGIARVPRIDDTGVLHFISGYDPKTGLYHDRSPSFFIPPTPSWDVARKAAEALLVPFSQYQFDDLVAGRALLLAFIFTALERPYLPVAPMFAVRSSMPGTGKGLIVRSGARLAFDTKPAMATWGGSSEEFEKRLVGLLLQSPGAISIDNANGMQIKGDLLESIITEGWADVRPLGGSDIVRLRNRSFITLTGNNPIITGDMSRRALPIDILPRSADPERDSYSFNPADFVERQRALFLRAAFTAMRAFRHAGMPRHGLPDVGSFGDWSRKVRDLVYWLTDYDVSEVFRRNKAEDPRRQADGSLLAALHQHFGTTPFKAADAIAICKEVTDHRRSPHNSAAPTPTEQTLYEALEEVLGTKDLNAKIFGYCARRLKGARIGGFILETQLNPSTKANDITVRTI